jgi:hypothetical protein
VSITDELLARNNPVGINPGTTVTNRFDYNRDGTVSVVDQLLARNNITTSVTKLKAFTAPSGAQINRLSAQGLHAATLPERDSPRLGTPLDHGLPSKNNVAAAAMSRTFELREVADLPKRSIHKAERLDDELLELLVLHR